MRYPTRHQLSLILPAACALFWCARPARGAVGGGGQRAPATDMSLNPRKDRLYPDQGVGRASGLAFTVWYAGWPSLTVPGGMASGRGIPIPYSFTLGMIGLGKGGKLTDQEVTPVSNTLTFSEGGVELLVTVTRLSPATVLETQAETVHFFVPEKKPVDKHTFVPKWFGFKPKAPAGSVKPLRWAAPGPGGKVATGVLGRQERVEPPIKRSRRKWVGKWADVIFIPLAESQANGRPARPPLEELGSSWLLFWYGSDSPFIASRVPFGVNVFAAGPNPSALSMDLSSWPCQWPWPAPESVFHADVPLLLVLSKAPRSIAYGAAEGITVTFPGGMGKAALMPLFGHVAQRAEDTEKWLRQFPAEVAKRCDAWAKRLAEIPVDTEESVDYDPRKDRVTFTEQVKFITLRPGGKKMSPLPAMLALAHRQGLPVEFSGKPEDWDLPTLFGPVVTVPGTSYTWSVRGLGRYVEGEPVLGPSNPKASALERELAAELEKVLKAGHLRPYYARLKGLGTNTATRYWSDPSESLYFLSEILPTLPDELRSRLVAYLKGERAKYPPETLGRLKDGEGTPRERNPEIADIYSRSRMFRFDNEFYERAPSLYRAYGLACYHRATGERPSDDTMAFCRRALAEVLKDRQWDTLAWFRGKRAVFRSPAYSHRGRYYRSVTRLAHRDLAGLIGYLRLSRMRGEPCETEAWGQLARLAAFRFALARYARYQAGAGMVAPPNEEAARQWSRLGDFSKPGSWSFQVLDINQHGVDLCNGAPWLEMMAPTFVVYLEMAPEVARMMADWGLGEDTRLFLDRFAIRQPNWYAAHADAVQRNECRVMPPSDSHQMFMAHAWIVKTRPEQLERYIDVPWLERGDLFYLHKLAETIKAYRGVKWK